MISQFSKIHGAVICSDLGTKIKLEHLAKMMLETEFVISVNNMSPTSVTNIKIEEALRLTLNKSFAFFDISCRNDPTASQRKIMKIISVRYFTAIFKKPFTKLIEFFRLLILKSFKNLHFLAHFSSKSKIFQDHLKVGKHFYCTCIKFIFEINDSVSIIYKSFI